MMRARAIFAAFALALAVATPVAAGPFEDGVAAYNRQDYATTLRLFRPLAVGGNATAQYNLGFMYANGQGVPQDYREAVKWYRLAAGQGAATAQFALGVMYVNGQGVPQDYREAVKWYRLAAEQDDADAQNNLGFMYAKGQGVPQDFIRAHMWFNLAAAQSQTDASKQRDAVATLMTPAQIAEAQKLASEWKPTKK